MQSTKYESTQQALPTFHKEVVELTASRSFRHIKHVSNNTQHDNQKKSKPFALIVVLLITIAIIVGKFSISFFAENNPTNPNFSIDQGSQASTSSLPKGTPSTSNVSEWTEDLENSNGDPSINPTPQIESTENGMVSSPSVIDSTENQAPTVDNNSLPNPAHTDTSPETILSQESSSEAIPPVESPQASIDMNNLIGESRVRGLAYFTIFEKNGKYYFNFAVRSGSRVNYLDNPILLTADGMFATGSYSDDNQGNSGSVQITYSNGQRFISAQISNKELAQYDSYDNLNALILDNAEMYYDAEIKDYPIYLDYLAH